MTKNNNQAEAMEKNTKKVKLDPLLMKDLRSGEQTLVLKTLNRLRSIGNIGYIPELIQLLNQAPGEIVRKELIRFIADVKDKAVIPFIIAGLKDSELKEAREALISACWQSGLSYSNELPLFIQLFLEGDYATSLEAFTVIEEASFDLERGKLDKVLELVQSGIDKVSEEKKPLALELIKLLQE